jgi:alanine racemase
LSTDRLTRAWVEVQASALRRNLERIRSAMGPDAKVIPVVKADAYGLGADRAVGALEPADPWGFGVATVEEGRALRRMGVERPLLVLSPIPPGSYRTAVEENLTLSLSDLEGLGRLKEAVRYLKGTADFHVEVDTGMGRSGFDWRQASAWGPEVAERGGGPIRWTGCFTHLHSADASDPASVRIQWDRFRDALGAVDIPNHPDFMIHVANSAGALRCGDLLPPVARPGIFLYGGFAGENLPVSEPVVTVRALVLFIRDTPPGSTLGYGATYTATGWERWATLGIGYGDGLPRALSNRGHALIRGQRVPIIGRVSMDVTVVNISGLDGVELGDVATMIGRDGGEEITLNEVAERVGTIDYEILTGLGLRLPRIWVDDGGE